VEHQRAGRTGTTSIRATVTSLLAVLLLGHLPAAAVPEPVPDARGTSAAAAETIAALDTAVPLADSVPGDLAADRLVITWRTGTSPAVAEQALAGFDTSGELFDGFSVQVVDLPAERAAELVVHLDAHPAAVSVVPDEVVEVTASTLASDQWGLRNVGQHVGSVLGPGRRGIDVGAPAAWQVTKGRSGIVVAIVDTGFDTTHPDLRDNLWEDPARPGCHGRNVISGGRSCTVFNPGSQTEDRHGTHVAGIVAAAENGSGTVGVAPRVSLMSVKALDVDRGYASDVITGIQYAAANGAHVINTSLGFRAPPSSDIVARLRTVVAEARVPIVAAAGNHGRDVIAQAEYPAALDLPNVVAVGAVDNVGTVPAWSNHSTRVVDVVAPGEGILSTVPGGGHAMIGGTSQAAPMVSGVLALAISESRITDGGRLATALRDSARPFGSLSNRRRPSGASQAGLVSAPGVLAALGADLGACVGGAPRGGTGDVLASDVHTPAIDCVLHRGLAGGFPDGTYRPGGTLTRGQVATFLANLVRTTRDLDVPRGDRFADVVGSPHRDNVAALAELGIVGGFADGTFRPGAAVTRDQFASILVRTYEHLTGGQVRPSADAPRDARGSVHEDNVRIGTQLGFVQGRADGNFRPRDEVTRAQMASFLRRAHDKLVNDRVAGATIPASRRG
jgi:hypothetical protein